MRLLTVSTISYLNQVDVLFAHCKQYHPSLKLTLLIADCSYMAGKRVQEALGPDIDVLCTEELGFDFVEDMRRYYSPLEFCSALKVLGCAYILQNKETCLYLDPDIVILDSIENSILRQPGDIVACCHSFSPLPDDGDDPEDLDFCLSGHINGGVLLARSGTNGNAAIDWLVEKTKKHWFISPGQGMYADQQWLSSLPYYFSDRFTLVSDLGVNVAYWNLHERSLYMDRVSSTIRLSTGEPLRLFHFSGFSDSLDGRISKHSMRKFDFETEKAVQYLSTKYAQQLKTSKQKYINLTGDLRFCNKPLRRRMAIAASFHQSKQVSKTTKKLLLPFLS